MEGRRERKVVTVLFADLVGFTARAEQLDPEDVEAILRPYHERLRGELERHGGTVEKFIGDAVMALFGAPVAHEDDPERAIRAALAIREFAVEERLELRIGITTGEALIALDASPVEGEGVASGDVVNTAARLQSAAPVNGILADETTYRSTRRAIEYRDAPAVIAEGKSEPVPVWEVVAARSRLGVETGTGLGGDRRGEAFAAWRRFIEALADQRPLVLVLEDLHWADEGLLDFVDELVDWLTGVPLLVVCSARPELLERRPGWGGGTLNASTIGLSPLTNDQTAALISNVLERSLLPAET